MQTLQYGYIAFHQQSDLCLQIDSEYKLAAFVDLNGKEEDEGTAELATAEGVQAGGEQEEEKEWRGRGGKAGTCDTGALLMVQFRRQCTRAVEMNMTAASEEECTNSREEEESNI